jgi:hypothetical protein
MIKDVAGLHAIGGDSRARHWPFMATVLGAGNRALMMSTESVELVTVETLKAAAVFAEAVVAGIEATVRAIDTDISTPKGHGAIVTFPRGMSSEEFPEVRA